MSQQINLFNPIFLKERKYFSVVAMAQALGLLLLGSGLMIFYANYQVSKLNKDAVLTAAQLETAQTQLAKVKAEYGPRQKNLAQEQEIKRAETEMQSLKQVFDILQKGEIGNTKGYSGYLRAFSRQVVDGVWLTGLSIVGAGNEIALQGRALRPDLVPAYMNSLKREPVMNGKAFATLEMQTPAQTEQSGKSTADSKQRATAGYIEFSLR